ncbi:MAG TPA: YafY family protein [Blastocatellia bacterium]|nr:YafY family protein [Blastocatellia bacterium]
MNRMERLTAILLLLQEKSRTSEEIAGRFEVSKRTILRDMQALSEMGMPIIAQEGARGGYSLPQHFALSPFPFTRNEVFLLMLALSAIARLSDAPFGGERESLMAKLRASLNGKLPEVEGILEKVSIEIPTRQERAPLLETLLEAARDRKWVVINYTSAGFTSSQHIQPTNIYTMNGLWYCRAYSHERGDHRTYRVDRIESLSDTGEDFQPYSPPESQLYHHESHPEVIATLTPRGVSIAESDPHFADHVIKAANGWGTLSFRCPPNELNYYARWFASFGAEIQVDAPDELRQRLCDLGQKLIKRYQKR